MSVPQLDEEPRGEEILAVLDTAFGELLAADPAAFRVKFRKMAASAFAFYRGTACLFYHDLDAARSDRGDADTFTGPYLDDRRRDLLVENAKRFAGGQPLVNVVDKRLWF